MAQMKPNASLLEQRLAAVGHEFEHGMEINTTRIAECLQALGNPQNRCGRVIHVAGTNGKGSTCAFLWSLAEAAGMRVHVFTSPHLIVPNERIRIYGKPVSDEMFITALDKIAATGKLVTYFEAITAAAFILFSENPADLVVLETGLGGSYDATNVVAQPVAAVITPIDLDHMRLLGDTIIKIAGEKAGIIKQGRPVMIARQQADALHVIETRAQILQSPVIQTNFKVENNQLHVAGHALPLPALPGAHQYENAAVAVTALLQLNDPRITAETLARGLQDAYWPGRMQKLESGALAAPIHTAGGVLWVDGAHNPHGARALAETLRSWCSESAAPIVLIIGALNTKDITGFLQPLLGCADSVIAVPVQSSKASRTATETAQLVAEAGFNVSAADNLLQAAERAARDFPKSRVVICGSLYLVGEALEISGYVIR